MARSLKRKIAICIVVIVVALAALIINGVLQGISNMACCTCVSSPVNEMVTKIQKAQIGSYTGTETICMNAGARFTAESMTSMVTNVDNLEFRCEGDAVCKNKDPIDVSSGDAIVAIRDARFKALISCAKLADNSSKYDCTIIIIGA